MLAQRSIAAAVAVVALFATALSWTPMPAGAQEAGPGLGVYRGAGAPREVEAFGTWLGRSPGYTLDYFPADTWETISNPLWSVRRWAGSPYHVIYSVPLLPDTGGTNAEGATGAYDSHFMKLAALLVAYGEGDATLRLGWEFNGAWYRWSAQSDPATFVAYWRRVVDAMRSVPGADFRFDWSVVLGTTQFPLEQAYPGDAYVDVIAADLYDQSWYEEDWGNPVGRWQRMLDQTHGLNWMRSFAAAHGKPMGFPEWGLSQRLDSRGGGDSPYFIERMHEWFVTNNVVYQVYQDFDSAADQRYALTTGIFPLAALRYVQLFGPLAETPPGESPTPVEPTPDVVPAPSVACPPPTASWRFVDIVGNVHEDAIDCITARGIAQGGPGGLPGDEYGPRLDVQRDQMASFIARMIDSVAPGALPAAPAGNRFSCDVGPGNVHFDAIQRLAAAGVVVGGPGGTPADCYGPNLVMRRDQMTSFLNRAIAQVTGSALSSDTDFFADDVTSVHHPSINALAAQGIVVGRGDRSYHPTASVRRDQMASFTARTLDYLMRP